MTDEGAPTESKKMDELEAERYRLDRMRDEFMYRRTRRTEVVNWCNTLLIAIAAGSLALTQDGRSLSIGAKCLISVASILLAACAHLWWKTHDDWVNKLKEWIRASESQLGIKQTWPDKRACPDKPAKSGEWVHWMRGIVIVWILAFVAALAPWAGIFHKI